MSKQKFNEIKELLTTKQVSVKAPQGVVKEKNISIWDDKEKLKAVKAPLPKSVLVIKKAEEEEKNSENLNFIENALISNNIPVTKSFKNKTGDLLVVCESKDTRDQIKNLVSTTNHDIICSSPQEKRSSITIVGLPKEYKKEKVLQILPLQNDYIMQHYRQLQVFHP